MRRRRHPEEPFVAALPKGRLRDEGPVAAYEPPTRESRSFGSLRMKNHVLPALGAASLLASFQAPARRAPTFVAHEIATGLTGGYQVIATDLNRDGKPDLVALASGLPELVWFENPTWKRHVIASGMRGLINVSAADLDDDGVPELAVASGFSTRPDQSSGDVALFTHGTDPTQPWTMRVIDHVPSAHRLRWYVDGDGQRWLINAPLAAASARPPNYDGATPIYVYRAPDFKRDSLPSDESGVVHSIEPVGTSVCERCLLSAGFAGIHRYEHSRAGWTHALIAGGNDAPVPNGGSSDAAIGRLTGRAYVIASIEPWHGNQVVVYRGAPAGAFSRTVIDSSVVDGHTLVTADLDGDGVDEIIVGQRGGSRSVWIYSTNRDAASWSRATLDDGGMAAAGCVAVDLNADTKIDIACIGTATMNLKWYENLGPARPPGR